MYGSPLARWRRIIEVGSNSYARYQEPSHSLVERQSVSVHRRRVVSVDVPRYSDVADSSAARTGNLGILSRILFRLLRH